MASSDTTFIPRFVKVSLLVQNRNIQEERLFFLDMSTLEDEDSMVP
jgi:hypothetical protein